MKNVQSTVSFAGKPGRVASGEGTCGFRNKFHFEQTQSIQLNKFNLGQNILSKSGSFYCLLTTSIGVYSELHGSMLVWCELDFAASSD